MKIIKMKFETKRDIIVFGLNNNTQKMITIPKHCNIEIGDKVGVYKIVEDDDNK